MKNSRLVGLMIATSFTAVAIFTILFMLVLQIPSMTFISSDMMFKLYTKQNFNDTMLDVTEYYCSQKETNLSKIYCVYNIFSVFYDYKERNDSKIRTPTKTLMEGGLCRDAALFYCAAFNRLDIPCKTTSVNNHIFNTVYWGDGDYCTIDQLSIDCKSID